MALSLPYPNSPQDGDAFLSLPVRSNVNAITQAIQSFDGSQIQAGSIAASALTPAANPITRGNETLSNFVSSGCIWSTSASLTTGMTSGIIYVNGIRVSVITVASKLFTASQDTYVDIDSLGNVYYLPVGNGGTSPALTGNSVRVAKIVTSASAVTSVVQSGSDSIGNIIYPTGAVSAVKTQNPYKFSVYRNGTGYATPVGSPVIMDAKTFDTGSNYNTTTGYFTVPVAGFYFFSATLSWSNVPAGNGYGTNIVKSSVVVIPGNTAVNTYASASLAATASGIVQCAAGDNIAAYGNYGMSAVLIVGPNSTIFQGFLVSTT